MCFIGLVTTEIPLGDKIYLCTICVFFLSYILKEITFIISAQERAVSDCEQDGCEFNYH